MNFFILKFIFQPIENLYLYKIYEIIVFLFDEALVTKDKLFIANFTIRLSRFIHNMNICSFRNIGRILGWYWSFYGRKIPAESSFSLNKVAFNSSISLTTNNFCTNLVFFYSLLTSAMMQAVKKILQKLCFSRNAYLLPLPPKF